MIEAIDVETGVIVHMPDDDDLLRRFGDAVKRTLEAPSGPRKEAMRRHVYAQRVRVVNRKKELYALLERQLHWLDKNRDDERWEGRFDTWVANLRAHEACCNALDMSWECL